MAALERLVLAAAAVVVVLLGISVSTGVEGSGVAEILEENGLPKGLLPGTVKSYSLSDDGKFEVTLSAACQTKISSEEVSYKKSITGKLSYGKITSLSGIQAKEFFWISITSIEVDKSNPDILWFEVGFLAKSLSVDLFQVPPTCNSLAEDEEAGSDRAAMSFSEWLQKALGGTLEAAMPYGRDSGAAARRILQ